ncbi:MAG: hypothetical protein HUU35_20545 [Armatimonadetes bacterium]|nr:hypothetical protein [Armatimonadota bacterium]
MGPLPRPRPLSVRGPLDHSLFEGLWNTNNNLFELNRYGFGWACGSLLLALIHLGWGRRGRLDSLLLAYSLGLAAVYTAYWYHGVAFGPRFFHPLLLPLVAWTTKGVGLLGGWLGRPQRVAATLLLAVVVAWATWLPLELLTTYHHNRGREADDREIVALARAVAGGRPALVIQLMERRGPGQVVPDYGIGFSLNPPGFRGDVLVARELNQEGESQVAALRRAFGERVMLLWYKNAGVNKLVPWDGSKREQ